MSSSLHHESGDPKSNVLKADTTPDRLYTIYMPFDIDNDIDFDADKVDAVGCAQSGHNPRQVAYMTLTSPLSSNLTLSLTSNLTLTRSHTHLLMEFGHFLAHDISLTSQAELDCCSPEVGTGGLHDDDKALYENNNGNCLW